MHCECSKKSTGELTDKPNLIELSLAYACSTKDCGSLEQIDLVVLQGSFVRA
jgi:hypothetical protein